MKLKRSLILFLLLNILTYSLVSGYSRKDDPVFNALQDEINRSLKKLKMKDLQKPYFISAGIKENRSFNIEATFGALIRSDKDHSRDLFVDVRVGDYQLDNSNYGMNMFSGIRALGRSRLGSKGNSLTLEDDYSVLRHEIWYYIDDAYKEALEEYAGKKSALSNSSKEDRPGDLTKEDPVQYSKPPLKWDIDYQKWKEKIKKVSNVFKEYPYIKKSSVSMVANYDREYILNTEGTEIVENEPSFEIKFNAVIQNESGVKKSSSETFFAQKASGLPDLETLTTKAEEVCSKLKMVMDADTSEYYVGPVLFSGDAALTLFSKLISKQLISVDVPVVEQSKQRFLKRAMDKMGLGSQTDKMVCARMIDVYDDPTIEEYKGTELLGHYRFDKEGVPAQRVDLIKKGILKKLLNHRRPTKQQKKSNGHGRIGAPGIVGATPSMGNLFIESRESISAKKIKDKLIEKCRESGLEYAYIVKEFHKPSEEERKKQMMSAMMSMRSGGSASMTMLDPLLIYRVNVESGEKKLVKNMQFDNLNASSLKDLVAASDQEHVLNRGGSNQKASLGVSVIGPKHLLLEELELSQASTEELEPPYLPHPYFTK